MPSESVEDYLKNIYVLQQEGKKVNTGNLAVSLSVSPASVSEMVNKLSRLKWIKNEPYHGFRLTKEGERISINLIRKHRLLEVFLSQYLKYDWDEVHAEAERIEHCVSDKFIDKLEEFLSYPKFDPHGHPIPDKNGNLKMLDSILLTSAVPGRKYTIAGVSDESVEILRYFSRIGVKLNASVVVSEVVEFDGSVIIILNNKKQLLSRKMAEQIFII